MNLGDALAENFKLKAQLVRLNYGLFVTVVWLVISLCVLFSRFILSWYLLKALHAPPWVWFLFWITIPLALLLDQFEKRSI